jgi:hypothetical protein|tara:strand:- start:7996 stop:9006 length:1011 start_codon:yes stop_codon:yes gene_type:complete
MAEAKTVEEEQEEEFVVVTDEDETEGQVEGEGEGTADDDNEDEDEGDDQEARLGGGREDDDEDDKRERRRKENKSRRSRQKEARERTERELKFLQNRNEQLEQRFSHFEQETHARVTGSEIANVDGAIGKAKSDLQLANSVIQQAVEQNDGKNLAEALDHRDTIRDNLKELTDAKQYLSTNPQRGSPAAQQQPLDPRHVAHAQSFMVDNSWWDPQGRDQDSQAVLQIDRSLVEEGFDPTSKDYWDELRTRTQEAIPGRFDSRTGSKRGNGAGKPANRGPQFRTGGRERPLKKNEVYISPDRKEAMIEAGVWDDPVLRNKYLKSYATYDTEANAGGA